MKTSSFAAVNNPKVEEVVFAATEKLASAAFLAAQKGDLMSVAVNNFLVYLGLIKCEDKKFKLDWDLKGCLIAVAHLVKQPMFPSETKTVLQLFLSKFAGFT
ncbi:uncharacterized protein LOC135226594 isoform X2 [Macrobrachium nipponense]|uniref:uncharacterized protein LOC135226594 isoform X2 n=1 Tax=Macrobrachium nipponense TaxID=159736 RepID=UPI0030C7B5ED